MAHEVDLLIRVRDEATKKLGLFADNMTEFQRRISTTLASRQAGMGSDETNQLKKQFEDRFNLEDRLYRATHNFKQIALKDTDEYFAAMRVKWQNNQSMLTMIDRTQAAERKRIMADYAASSQSQMSKFVNSFLGKGTMYGVAAFAAVRAINTITDAHKRWRESEKTTADYLNLWAESIPLFGSVSRSVRELATELSGLAEAEEKAAKVYKFIEAQTNLKESLEKSILRLNTPVMDRPKLDIQESYDAREKELEKEQQLRQKIIDSNAEIQKQIDTLQKGAERDITGIFGKFHSRRIENLQRELIAVPPDKSSMLAAMAKEQQLALEELRSKPIEDITASLQEQINTWGMNAGQIALYKAEIAGATAEELAHIQVMNWKLKALEDEKNAVEALKEAQKKKDEEEAAAAKSRLEKIDLFVQSVRKMIQTPAQEFQEYQKKLEEALGLGMITQEEFYKARNKRAEQIFGKGKTGADSRSTAWSPFESRLMTTAPGGRTDPTVEVIKTSNRYLKDIAKNTQQPRITPTANNIEIIEL